MPRTAVDTRGPALQGRAVVTAELERRGWTVRDATEARVRLLECESPGGSRVHVRIKAKTRGTWQGTVTSGAPEPAERPVPTFWVFVDLGSSPRTCYVVPDGWMRRDIHREHQAYLDRNGGHRAENDDSRHHSIGPERIEQWRERWELLEGDWPSGAHS